MIVRHFSRIAFRPLRLDYDISIVVDGPISGSKGVTHVAPMVVRSQPEPSWMPNMWDEQIEIAGEPRMARLSLYWVPVVVYATLIFYLSSLSHPEDLAPPLFEVLSDTVLHAVEYGILGVLCYRAFRYAAGDWAARYAILLAIVTSTIYGLTDELHQAFVPFRHADALDLLTDLAGATIGAWGWYRMIERSDDAGVP
jgi:VanZ family protein